MDQQQQQHNNVLLVHGLEMEKEHEKMYTTSCQIILSHRGRQIDRQTDRQTQVTHQRPHHLVGSTSQILPKQAGEADRQTDRQTDRHIDRQRIEGEAMRTLL